MNRCKDTEEGRSLESVRAKEAGGRRGGRTSTQGLQGKVVIQSSF